MIEQYKKQVFVNDISILIQGFLLHKSAKENCDK